MELTQGQAFELIIGFSKLSKGYWKNCPIKSQTVMDFIEAGFASLDREHQEKYVLTQKGTEILHPFIAQIHEALVDVAKKNMYSVFGDEAISHLSKTYDIELEMAENLYYYVTSIGEINGYVPYAFSQGNRCGIEFRRNN